MNRILFVTVATLLIQVSQAAEKAIKIDIPPVVLSGIPAVITFSATSSSGTQLNNHYNIENLPGIDSISPDSTGSFRTHVLFPASGTFTVKISELQFSEDILVLPGWISILPPLLAIILAFLTRQVLLSLFFGVLTGATLIHGLNPFSGFLYGLSDYIVRAAAEPDKISIIMFSLVLGGMVGVLSRMGGLQALVDKLTPYAVKRTYGQVVTWLMGILIFFDDYANTLIVGNTMRPLTDKLKISREKLAYLVDTTAAPVANIAIISTWIGFELGLLDSGFKQAGISQNSYLTFIKTIPYNFYPIFALWFGLLISVTGRDFSLMRKAEERARTKGELLAPSAQPLTAFDDLKAEDSVTGKLRWYHGLIPVVAVIFTTFAGLWFTGYSALSRNNIENLSYGIFEHISMIIGASDPFKVLLWASFTGSILAILIACVKRALTLEKAVTAWTNGIKAMLPAALILILAWSIGQICSDIKTADYIIEISKSLLEPHFLPALTFITAGVISFATGTSWGVMAVLMPIVIPLVHHHVAVLPELEANTIWFSTIASVLAGSTFGDHCSPISDTTVMSSMASSADHIDHVRTQLPYALLTALIALICGYLPSGFGIPWWISLTAGLLLTAAIIHFFGGKNTGQNL